MVISYYLWQHRFAGASDVLGKTVPVDGEQTTIIGVMPDRWMLFNYPSQLWTPYRSGPGVRGGPARVVTVARLRPAVTTREAQAEMDRLAAALGEAFPSTNKGWGIRLEPALDVYVGWIRRPLLLVQAVVVLALLIACANVAGLLLMKVAERKREVAVRAALGAGQWPIARQFLNESILLALLGGLVGIGVAKAGLRLFVAISPAWFPRVGEIALDARMLSFTALLSFATALVFGAIPAAQASRPNLIEILKDSTRGTTAATRQQRLRAALVVSEISLAMMLVIGAGLMVNTFLRLSSASTGCDTRNIVTFQVRLPTSEFTRKTDNALVEASSRTPAVFEKIRERVSNIRGVESAAVGIRPPLSESALDGLKVSFTPGSGRQLQSAACFPVSVEYFHTLRVPILRGREFRSQDSIGGSPVAVINEAMARRFWPDEDPIARYLRIALPGEPTRQIVGVVGDLRHNRYEREFQPQLYVPYVQQSGVPQPEWLESRLSMIFVIRATDPARIVPALRAAVAEVNGNLPVFNIKSLDDYLTDQLWQPRQTMILLAIFSAIALVLALIGVYGIMAYAVRQRTHEIGIRMALGANTRDVLRLVMGRALLLIAYGVAIGIVGSLALMRLLGTMLWGVTPTDPLTYLVAIIALATVAILACYLPARRVLGVDAAIALRHE
jgi:putative ABC transport system permease protein